MTELQRLARRLADDYEFECQGGPLRNCTEWIALCAAIAAPAVDPPPSGASPQAETSEAEQKYGIAFGRLDGESIDEHIASIKRLMGILAPVSPVEPEPPTNPPCVRCGHALSAHRPEFGACDGRERPCACPEYQAPTVEPEPCVWRDIDSAPKDGTEILVGSASLGPVVVKWKEGRSTMRDTDWMVSWDGDYLASEPYGWMPIPAPLKVER